MHIHFFISKLAWVLLNIAEMIYFIFIMCMVVHCTAIVGQCACLFKISWIDVYQCWCGYFL